MSLKTKISPNLVSLVFSILVISFVISFYIFAAWTEPSQAPPAGNVSPPLNTSSESQTKVGGLILNSGGADNALLIYQKYLKLAESSGIPPAGDCDNSPVGTELGRMIIDIINNRLYICGTAGWSFIGL